MHTNNIACLPRVGVNRKARSQNRWGDFQRLVPVSLATVNTRKAERLPVPDHIRKPYYVEQGASSKWLPQIPFNDENDLKGLEKACSLAREILKQGGKMCQPGVTTNTIDKALHTAIVANGAYPSPLNYMGFPKSICTSINNVIAHGIPDDRSLEDGDIINIDVTVYLDGYHGDTSATFLVGQVDDRGRALVECTKEALESAIAICGPDVPLKEIGRVISDHAEKHGYTVSDEMSGHGIGEEFHCFPLIYHHRKRFEWITVNVTLMVR
ncbi:Methionine aminopeptidase 1D, chloroplastic/mitochondrial [Apophysomyces ossiformis]|uniref:Methionine aminopeptidase n=1 Tax=Apophysomyces ossiformis TaxID=679940 RepID=A0A8H7BT88_9FUNG|nr:Methionine aminopeptidase 1D, chloroplastic/mitochondrial [Apophysomyces ossiformis]